MRVKNYKTGVGWMISKPHNPQSNFGYMWGTIELMAAFKSERPEFEGKITLRPSGLVMFDGRGRERSSKFQVMSLILTMIFGNSKIKNLASKADSDIRRLG